MSTSNRKTAASIVWFEIPADDLNRAKEFYGRQFGCKIAPFPGMRAPEAQNYLDIDAGGPEASPDGGIMSQMQPEQCITNYVSVPSVARFMARVEKLGAKFCKPRAAVPEMGYFAVCQDTEGNTYASGEQNEQAK